MAPSLATLPVELQLQATRFLEHPHDKLRLMLCSRYFYDLVLPILYDPLVLRRSPTGAEFAAIVRTIFVQKPHLASCVRTLQVWHWDVWGDHWQVSYRDFKDVLDSWMRGEFEIRPKEGDYENDEQSNPGNYDFSFVHEQLKLASLSEAEEKFWKAELEAFNGDAWLSLLLIMLPNLRRLELQFPYPRCRFIPWVLDRAGNRMVGNLPALKSLSQVALDWWDTEGGLDLNYALLFFRFQSVRRFFGNMVVEYGFEESSREVEAHVASIGQTASITHIELHESNSFSGMKPLIGICKNLISFKYGHAWGCVNGEDFDSEAFHSALYSARHTLETIAFEDNSGCSQGGPFPPFRDFTALKTLHLDVEMLPECSFAEGLPPSIEILQISNSGDVGCGLRPLIEKLEEHVRNDLDQTPALSKIIIEVSLGVPSPPPKPGEAQTIMFGRNLPRDPAIKGVVLGLEGACTDAGIQFELHDSRESFYHDPWGGAGFQGSIFST